MSTMEEFCRACLNSFTDPNELQQYSEESRRLFIYSTGLQVKRNDLFTFQLCKECHFSMKTSCKFKKMCRTSDRKIKSYLALKDVDEGMDFSSFLKKHEESLIFRLPLLSGGTTPANQKSKDDDNESTCTSIQNFMTDILRADDIPDSEARIIREVIEEEADVLEDSLDSHWLQDDVSVDSDFQFNLSLSQFSTPHSSNKNRMCSPAYREVTSTDITSGEDYDNIPIDGTLKKFTDPVDSSYVLENEFDMGMQSVTNNRCVIDKNLEKALRDENNKEISLQELLASPSAFHNASGASTPTIKNILFGDNLHVIKKVKPPNFDCDVDLLGKLNNKKVCEKKLHKDEKDSNIRKLIEEIEEEGKLGLKKLLIGNFEDAPLQDESKLLQSKKDDLNMNVISVKEEKLDLEESEISQNINVNAGINTGMLQEGKTDSLENLFTEIEQKEKDVKTEKCELETKIEEDMLNLKKTDVQDMRFEKGQLDNSLGIKDFNIDSLLENSATSTEAKTKKIVNEKLGHINEKEIHKRTPTKSLGKGLFGEDSTDEILKEFIHTDVGKSDKGKNETDLPNIASVAQMDDSELTELLEETYDPNIQLNKSKKLLHNESSNKDKDINRNTKTQSYLGKKMKSLLENKYCVTNFYCKMCNKKFKDLKYLKAHFLKSHKYRIETPKQAQKVLKICDLCGKSFANIKTFTKHLLNHANPQEYQCAQCALKFKTKNALSSHMSTHSKALTMSQKSTESNTKYICNICGAQSTSSSNHLTHQRRHLKNYTVHCVECGKGFYRKTELEIHLRCHTGEKPFPCSYCNKSFTRRDSLNRHNKLHTAEKQFCCESCGRKFSRRYDFKNHNCIIKVKEELLEGTECYIFKETINLKADNKIK